MTELKKGQQIKFVAYDGTTQSAKFIALFDNKALVMLSPSGSGMGWRFSKENNNVLDTKYKKEVFDFDSKIDLEKATFCWVAPTMLQNDDIQPGEDSKKTDLKKSDMIDKNNQELKQNTKEELKMSSELKEESLLDYGKDCLTEGARLAVAKKLIDKCKQAIVAILVDDMASSSETKVSDRQLKEYKKYAKMVMSGKVGFALTGAALGFLIKGAGSVGGKYTEVLRHPEIQKLARAIHVRTVADGGDYFLDKIEEAIAPMIGQLTGQSQLRVLADDLQKGRVTVDDTDAEKEIVAIEEHSVKSAKTMAVPAKSN